MQNSISLRPERPADNAFIYKVFCSTRPDVTYAPLPQAEIERMLRWQFQAQYTDYHRNYPDASYSIVLLDGVEIGRIYVDWRPADCRILDIAILPDYRGKGIGSRLVRQVIEESLSKGKPVSIHVELNSREIKFYERLGFVKISEIPSHQLMACTTSSQTLVL